MKRFVGLLSVIVLLAACHRPVETRHGTSLPPALTAIDTLMQTRPDSALTLLLEAPVDDPYYQLLLSEALYKNDSAQLNRRELLDAMAYYDSVGCPFLAARCHYMNGVGFYETDSVVPACEEYLRALEIMEDHFDEKDLVGSKAKFMALTYTRLTDIFSDQYLHEQAINLAQRSLLYYRKYDISPRHLARMLEEIGSHFDMMKQLDSADYYYTKAMDVLTDTNCLTYRDIASHRAYLLYETSKSSEAPLSQLYTTLGLSHGDDEIVARCLTIAEIYYHERLFDSAYLYLERVVKNSSNAEMTMQAVQWMVELLNEHGDTLSANQYALLLAQFANAGDQHGHVDSKLAKLFQTHLENREKQILSKRIKSNLSLFIVLVFIGILAVSVIVFSSRNNHKRLYTIYTDALQREKLLKEENNALKAQNQLEQRLPKYPITEYQALLQEEICLELKQKLSGIDILTTNKVEYYSDFSISTKKQAQFVEAVERHCSGFSSYLRKRYPKLNSPDIDYCRFLLIGLSEKEIGVLLQQNRTTVWRRFRRIKAIMGTEDPMDDLKKMFFIES